MSHNAEKFLFLGIVIIVTAFANRDAIFESRNTFRDASLKSEASLLPPILALSPPVFSSAAETSSLNNSASSTLGRGGDNEASSSLDENFGGALRSGSVENEIKDTYSSLSSLRFNAGILEDLELGALFYTRNETRRWPSASLTKLMTAVVVMNNYNLNETTTLVATDFVADNSNIVTSPGEVYSIRDLLHMMLLSSSNEAAEALARVSGRENFIGQMNDMARSWGAFETYFDDPTGLSVANQSTAKDLSLVALRIYREYRDVFSITTLKQYSAEEKLSGSKKIIKSINSFAGRPDFLGGKTGYTDEAGGNLLSLFNHRGKPILVVVLGTGDRFGDTERLFNWYKLNF